ncbi:hypothetical protein [Aureivirga sp. CE67]|uniref:hypothetical protein n=1 Tax=Aureivirga sp. CE67 TaxID=1788983 RepID=UPI0018C9609B|nr:hypothetical protein [Aureivirga sp. CE67]
MKKYYWILIGALLYSMSSYKNSSFKTGIEKDHKKLQELLNSPKVIFYRALKIGARSIPLEDSIPAEVRHLKLKEVNTKVFKHALLHRNDLSLSDYVSIYLEYRKLSKNVKQIDEDIYPTLSDTKFFLLSNKSNTTNNVAKIQTQNSEHLSLSLGLYPISSLKEVSLYEISKVHTPALVTSKEKLFVQFFKSIQYFEHQLYYLSNEALNENITLLESDAPISLTRYKNLFHWNRLSDAEVRQAFLSLHYLNRGLNYLLIGEQNSAADDFVKFASNFESLHLENDLYYFIQTYLNLAKDRREDASNYVAKILKNNSETDFSEKLNVVQNYLERGKLKKAQKEFNLLFTDYLNSEYFQGDFLQKDFGAILDKPAEVSFFKPKTLETLYKNIENYSDSEQLKLAQKKLKEQGNELWEIIDDFFD